jgi:hypothetical protein
MATPTATVTCPICSHKTAETMPEDAVCSSRSVPPAGRWSVLKVRTAARTAPSPTSAVRSCKTTDPVQVSATRPFRSDETIGLACAACCNACSGVAVAAPSRVAFQQAILHEVLSARLSTTQFATISISAALEAEPPRHFTDPCTPNFVHACSHRPSCVIASNRAARACE